MQSTITFVGGAGAVTGSNFLLNTGGSKILVDCGLTQGSHTTEEKNWDAFSFDPSSIDFLIITHAHIDHIGRVPKLVHDGFRGRIISTDATRALAEPMLQNAQELTAHDGARYGQTPLYTPHDIDKALTLWETLPYKTKLELKDNIVLELRDSGHILGSAMVHFVRDGKVLVFTGDLGGGNSPLIPHADALTDANYLVIESVYGDRVRQDDGNRREQLENVIENAAARGGTLLIPAFSAERTQDLLFEIRMLMTEKRVPSMRVYLDSPLAQKITAAYRAYPQYFTPELATRAQAGEDIFAFPELHFIESPDESAMLANTPNPKIILAGSGMSNGGRAIAHEKRLLPDPKSTVLICGYQAAGSLGRRILEGEHTVDIHKEHVPVRAHIEHIFGYSAHMDSEELLEFVNKTSATLKEVFVVMGEPAASSFLAQRVRDYLGVRATVPEEGSKTTIEF